MRALVFILVLLVASVASGNAQIGQTLPSQGEPGYIITLDNRYAVGDYYIGPAAALSNVDVVPGGGSLVFNIHACDEQTYNPATCDLGLTATGETTTARRYWVLSISTAESGAFTSQIVIKQNYSRVTAGAYTPPPPDTSIPPTPTILSATPGDTWVDLAWATSTAANHDSWGLDVSLGGANIWSVVTPPPTKFATTARASGLTNEQLYDFRLSDCNQVPTCSGYATISATPQAGLPDPADPLWNLAKWGDPNTPWGP
jgi:hypothetical protein